jgi:hypothetical protein
MLAKTRSGEKLISVEGLYRGKPFSAGCVAIDGRIVICAPILRSALMGLDGETFVAVCKGKGWKWEIVDGRPQR